MSRSLRILFKGAYYHVTNRVAGNGHLFNDKVDYQSFLKTVQEACDFFNVHVIAYNLRKTHYHMIVHTPEGNLPRFMRHINGVYTQRYNKRHDASGSILKGRYSAIVVNDAEYLLKCIRYIHLNSIETKDDRNNKSHMWSSHKKYLLGENQGRWLKIVSILKRFDRRPEKAIQKYIKFINEGIDKTTEDFYRLHKRGGIFGPLKYINDIRQNYVHSRMNGDIYEVPEAKKVNNEQMLNVIFDETCKEFHVPENSLYKSARGKGNLARHVLKRNI